MKVRKVGLSDLHELRDIGIKSYVPHYAHMWKPNGLEWYSEKCFGEEFLQNELVDANVEYYIISAAEQNIGILKLVLQNLCPILILKTLCTSKRFISSKNGQAKASGAK